MYLSGLAFSLFHRGAPLKMFVITIEDGYIHIMSKPNPFDLEDDAKRIASGLAPTSRRPAHSYRLSHAAHQELSKVREIIAALRPLDAPPSGSVAVEFLVWWFHESRKFDEGPLPAEFRAKTRKGRPTNFHKSREIPPSQIRKLAGVDPVTAERNLSE